MTIKQIQCLLTYLNYECGPIDGNQGAKTTEAIKEFQRNSIIASDGIAGNITQTALLSAVKNNHFKDKTTDDIADEKWWSEYSPYIAKNECVCPCGQCGGFPAEPNKNLILIANAIRDDAKTALITSSVVRCSTHNAEVGGVKNSAHLYGKAMDFRLQGKTASETLAYVKQHGDIKYCYAIDDSYVHMNV